MNFTMPFKRATHMRALTIGVLALGILSLQVGRGTMAFFTTQVTSTANAFTSGSLVFNITGDGVQSSPTSETAAMTLTLMKPGDTVYAPLKIENLGTLPAVYGIAYVTAPANGGSTDLASLLTLGIVHIAGATCNAAAFGGGTALSATGNSTVAVVGAGGPKMTTGGTLPLAGTILEPVSSALNAGSTDSTGIPLAQAVNSTTPTVDTLCVQVQYPNGSAAFDNTHNSSTTLYDTTISFQFDGLVHDSLVTKIQ